jgi:hypothetical protein
MQQTRLLLIVGGASLCIVSVLAQPSSIEKAERGLRSHPQMQFIIAPGDASLRPETQVFCISNVQYCARISDEALRSSPDWTPAKPLPLDFGTAEKIARKELGKLVADAWVWEVTGFHLQSVGVNVPNLDTLKMSRTLRWCFQVEMRPPSGQHSEGGAHPADSFRVFIDLSGQAGEIQTLRKP